MAWFRKQAVRTSAVAQRRERDWAAAMAQGILPPDMMRKAVMQDFVPAQGK